MIPVKIVGEGSFGSTLKNLLMLQSREQIEFSDDADEVILAVPLEAYEEVAKAHAGKHLINVCSVQFPSTTICMKYSKKVTSIHPLFGARTPNDAVRNCIVTYETPGYSVIAWRIFASIPNTKLHLSDTETHDRYMAKTHLQVVLLYDKIKKIMEDAKDVPEYYLTPSFLRLKSLSEQYLDMPVGTKTSILSNPFLHENSDKEFKKIMDETLESLRNVSWK